MSAPTANIAVPAATAALAAFHPERYGFAPYQQGWVKAMSGLGTIAVASLAWPHAQAPSYDLIAGRRVATDPLNLVVELQRRVWGMPSELLVPSNVLAILADTGGSVLVAYDLTRGFNADGWLGFTIALGARDGTLVSHMLGVREERRGGWDLGWSLKMIQAYAALCAGHTAMIWTFDPMRGANARLNLEKLGAVVPEFTIDKYGALPTTLYGPVPSDRFTAHWDLLAPRTWQRLEQVMAGTYRPLAPADVAALPAVTADSLPALRVAAAPRLRYRIPGDIDRLMSDDPRAAIAWRDDLRTVMSALVTTKIADLDAGAVDDPIAIGARVRQGAYVVNGFATGAGAAGERMSAYVLERHPAPTNGVPACD